jgi:hypothetical protein
MPRYGPPTANADDLVTLQTYAYATVLAELLRRKKQPTRQGLMEAARSLTNYTTGYEVPGVTFSGSQSTNFLLSQL